MRTALLLTLGALGVLAAAAVADPRASSTRAADREITVAAAGDIACDVDDPVYNRGRGTPTRCKMQATARILSRNRFDAVLALGDLQYPRGLLAEFRRSYAKTWGSLKSITRPVPGNHEYYTPGATGYFRYFGRRASPGRRYYSFELGAWHVIALNSNCRYVTGGCDAGSPQERWLRHDLAGHPNRCVLAYWHHPRFSSGVHGDQVRTAALFEALYDAGADLVLAAHDHDYERFAPQAPNGRSDPKRGIRTFVVGTGGYSLYRWGQIDMQSEARSNTTFGVLKLMLAPSGYSWKFIPVPGSRFADSGSGACR